MIILLAIGLVWGVSFAITHGTKAAGRAVAGRYRKVMSSWRASAGTNPAAPSPLGMKIGAATATALFGGWEVGRSFGAGVKEGWPVGRERGHEWWRAKVQNLPGDQPMSYAAPDASPIPQGPAGVTPPAPHASQPKLSVVPRLPMTVDPETGAVVRACRNCGAVLDDGPHRGPDAAAARKRLEEAAQEATGGLFGFRDRAPGEESPTVNTEGAMCAKCSKESAEHNSRVAGITPEAIPAAGATTQKEPNTMAIDTITGGEVTTLEQVRMEAEAIKAEATADFEDAQGDSQRAKEDLARVELYAASLETLQYGASVIEPARAMQESAASRAQAAEQRAQAAEARTAQADALLAALETPEGLRA